MKSPWKLWPFGISLFMGCFLLLLFLNQTNPYVGLSAAKKSVIEFATLSSDSNLEEHIEMAKENTTQFILSYISIMLARTKSFLRKEGGGNKAKYTRSY